MLKNKIDLKCTCCDSVLKITTKGHYQDMFEHVCNPNDEPSLKDGYTCPNETCIAYTCNVQWIESGECFTPKLPENITYRELYNELELKHGISFAVNSWNYIYELGKKLTDSRVKKINILSYLIVITPKQDNETYLPKRFSYYFKIYKKEEDYLVSIIPTVSMVKYCLSKFKRNYLKINAVHALKECLDIVRCKHFGRNDKRNHKQIASFIIKVFMYRKYKTVINLAKLKNI
jgi:hypothetical protein